MPWLNQTDAQRYVNRTDRTLRTWRKNRWVIAIKRGQHWWYDKWSLPSDLK